MKHQVVVIHGGDSFNSYEEYIEFLKDFELDFEKLRTKGWKDSLQDRLGAEFEVIQLKMPNSFNARYLEWKIWFDKHVPFFDSELVLVGHSLGGIFLVKYLSENKFPKSIKGILLVAACFDAKDADYTLADFVLPDDLSLFSQQVGNIILYHSKDDPVVPFADLAKYQKALSSAEISIFEDRKHFNQTEFPELVHDIKVIFND